MCSYSVPLLQVFQSFSFSFVVFLIPIVIPWGVRSTQFISCVLMFVLVSLAKNFSMLHPNTCALGVPSVTILFPLQFQSVSEQIYDSYTNVNLFQLNYFSYGTICSLSEIELNEI